MPGLQSRFRTVYSVTLSRAPPAIMYISSVMGIMQISMGVLRCSLYTCYSCYDCYSGTPLEMYCTHVQIQRNLSLNSNAKLFSIYLILAVLFIRRGRCWLSTRLALEESTERRKVRSGGARFATDCSPSSFEPSDLSCSFGGARCCFGGPSVAPSGL